MSIRIALAGNPNCGKTTLFNLLTGSDCHVGNWPGVTVEKRSGIIKSLHGAELVDLPGIYSLRTLSDEEGAALGFLINEKPDLIINVINANDLERSLYLTVQLELLGVPTVAALNMTDVLEKRGDKLDYDRLGELLELRARYDSPRRTRGSGGAEQGSGLSENREAAERTAGGDRHCLHGAVDPGGVRPEDLRHRLPGSGRGTDRQRI